MKKVMIILALTVIFSFIVLNAYAVHFLDKEAGISAYINAGKTFNSSELEDIKNLYRTIERETADYIVGSMPIGDYPELYEDYPETDDVHLYVHKDGWVVAYYRADEPSSKIIDWRKYTGGNLQSTKLQLALVKVSNETGYWLDTADIKYYNFACPQANKLLIVIDREGNSNVTDRFDILIPNDITVCERSWGAYGWGTRGTRFYIDGNQLVSFDARYSVIPPGPSDANHRWDFRHERLTPAQLTQGVNHIIELWNYNEFTDGWSAGAIVLVYKQP